MDNFGFLYRTYKESLGPIYNGDKKTLGQTFEPSDAEKWFDNHQVAFEEVEIQLPAKQIAKFSIPVLDDGDENTAFEEYILSDIRVDSKTRIIMNKLLAVYKFCHGGFFVKRGGEFHDKMHTKNMEILQLMKDVILGFVRIDPIKLDYEVGRGSNKKSVQHSWDIAEDLLDKTYEVNGKKYKTSIYGVYTRILRKSMFKNSEKYYDFYGGHEFQYFQRMYDLNYGSINYLCASRKSGKTLYGMYNTILPMFKSKTFKSEFVDKANLKTHFFVLNQGVVNNYSEKLKEFFYNLLVDTYKLTPDAANQIVEWKQSTLTMYLHTEEEDRTFEFVSERSSRRGERSARITMDECNYLGNYEEVSDFATKSGAGTVNQISTISQDSKATLFYKSWVEAMVNQRNQKPIDEIIHHIWTKYGFDKLKSREDYIKMIDNGVFDDARNEFYRMRPMYAMKVTLDDVEYISEDEKEVLISSSINSVTGWDGMLAEYYCELSPEKSAIPYRRNIIDDDKIPRHFDKIFAGYDEADTGDQATMVVLGVLGGKAYFVDQAILPKKVDERYREMTNIITRWSKKSSLPPSIIVDIGRGPIYFRETSGAVPYVDMGIKARPGSFEKTNAEMGVRYYSMGTNLLVDEIMNTEMLSGDKLFFSASSGGQIEININGSPKLVDGLFGQLDTYIWDGKTFKGKGKKKDDLVSALLYASYYAYVQGIKPGSSLASAAQQGQIERMDAQFEMKQRELDRLTKIPKKSIWGMR